MATQIEKYLARKPLDSYPDYVKKEMKIMSFFKKDLPISYGSFLYRVQKYSGDYDLLQHINYKDEETTINTFIHILKTLVKSLDKDHIYSEFKAGLDTKYLINIGHLHSGLYTPDKDLCEILYLKWKEDLFTDDEYQGMSTALEAIGHDPDNTELQCDGYDYIYNLIRNKQILRWTADEILKGYKIISKNRKYTLYEAIQDNTIVKIDLIVFLNNKFIEITNLILLTYIEKGINGDEKIVPINISEQALHNPLSLQEDIEKMYYSDKFYSPMKSCKRIYAFMRATNGHFDYLKNLIPVVAGEASLLYQLKSELEAILIVLNKKYNKLNLDRSIYQLQDIKLRFNYAIDLTDNTIIILSHMIDGICKLKSKETLIEHLEELIKLSKLLTNSLTIRKLNEYRFNPFPREFLPSQISYNIGIIRDSNDDPQQNYKNMVSIFEHFNTLNDKK